jgi:hypothetical protein
LIERRGGQNIVESFGWIEIRQKLWADVEKFGKNRRDRRFVRAENAIGSPTASCIRAVWFFERSGTMTVSGMPRTPKAVAVGLNGASIANHPDIGLLVRNRFKRSGLSSEIERKITGLPAKSATN